MLYLLTVIPEHPVLNQRIKLGILSKSEWKLLFENHLELKDCCHKKWEMTHTLYANYIINYGTTLFIKLKIGQLWH